MKLLSIPTMLVLGGLAGLIWTFTSAQRDAKAVIENAKPCRGTRVSDKAMRAYEACRGGFLENAVECRAEVVDLFGCDPLNNPLKKPAKVKR